MSEIVDLDFVLSIEEEENSLDDETIVLGIRGKNYSKVQERIEQFEAQCEEILEDLDSRVNKAQTTASTLLDEVARNTPGSPPSESSIDYENPASVRRYERELADYYKAKNLHDMLCGKAFRAQETYEALSARYYEKSVEVQAQLEQKNEELQPALEEDIVVFLENVFSLVSSCVEEKNEILVGFTATYISRKLYSLLEGKVLTAYRKRLAHDISGRIDSELNRIFENHAQALKEQYSQACGHIFQTFSTNASIFAEVKEYLASLPYEECNENAKPANTFMSITPETIFNYQNVINPSELNHISQAILDRKVKYQNLINKIEKFSFTLEPIFTFVKECQGICQQKLQAMQEVKQKAFGDTFLDYIFVLNIFLLKDVNWLQDDQLGAVQMIREQVEVELSVELEKFIAKTSGSNLLIGEALNEIESNVCIRFLSFEQGLIDKIQTLQEANKMLDEHLESVSRIPEEKSREARKEIWNLWFISLFPGLNLFFLAKIISTIKRFSKAFKSANPFYISLKKAIGRILVTYSTVYSVTLLGVGFLSISVSGDTRGVLWGVILLYAVAIMGSALGYLKLRKVERDQGI